MVTENYNPYEELYKAWETFTHALKETFHLHKIVTWVSNCLSRIGEFRE